MTAYREHELHRAIRNTRSRILLASYRTREHRDLAAHAADALDDLADALHQGAPPKDAPWPPEQGAQLAARKTGRLAGVFEGDEVRSDA